MSKMIEIDSCIVCEYFDRGEYHCEKVDRHTGTSLIPTWCPLPDTAGWLPIESAPRDGTDVLISGGTFWDDDCLGGPYTFTGVRIARWTGKDSPAELPWEGNPVHSHDEYRRHQPTHWMPLPAAPTNPEHVEAQGVG